MKRTYYVVALVLVATFLLVGCAKREGQIPRKEESGKVETPVTETEEFQQVRRRLLKDVIRGDTPVYRVCEVVEVDNSRFFIDRIFWVSILFNDAVDLHCGI